MKTNLPLRGRFVFEHWRNGILLAQMDFPNGITVEGKNDNLDAYFRNQTQPTNWYLGLIDATGYTALSENDTMSSHAGWTELTAYNEATRPEWAPDAASSKSITNATARDFTINASKTIKGGFVVSNNTKAGTSGILWATALAAADINVSATDVLKVTYTVNT